MKRRLVKAVGLAALALAACTAPLPENQSADPASVEPSPGSIAAAATDGTATTTSAPLVTSTPSTSAPLVTSTPSTSAPLVTSTPQTAPAFSFSISPADEEALGTSWRPGCPVGPDELSLITLSHWTLDGDVAEGQLIVHQDVESDIVEVFELLFEDGFPIERMELVQAFDADDDLSMAANNTSAFNCREVAWRPGVWSLHAYGVAIDINPLLNPYVSSTRLLPPEGAEFADRDLGVPGMIDRDGTVVEAFASIGWGWGGDWATGKDYQHFDKRR